MCNIYTFKATDPVGISETHEVSLDSLLVFANSYNYSEQPAGFVYEFFVNGKELSWDDFVFEDEEIIGVMFDVVEENQDGA